MYRIILSALFAMLFVSCTNYGKKVKSGHVDVYYKEGISKEDAEKTADLLYRSDVAVNNNTTDTKSIQIIKRDDTVCFRMVVQKEKLEMVSEEIFQSMGNVLSDSIFNGKPVNIDLTDNKFKTIKTIHYKKIEETEQEFGKKFTSGNVEVFAENFSNDASQELADFLEKEFKPENVISFKVSQPDNDYIQVKMASTEEKAAGVTEADMQDLAAKISQNVLTNAPIVFHLTDIMFNTIKKTGYHPEGKNILQPVDSTVVN
ncbi:MAG: hypothetical protein WBC06_03590 [Chitinophagaceae bacterium]